MKFFKKYGILILAVGVLGGILYLNRFSSLSRTKRGEALYMERCAQCHGNQGEGLRKLIPPLAGTDYVPAHLDELPCILRYGLNGEITVNGQRYNQPMPGYPDMEADEVKAIIDYLIVTWYPESEKPSQAEVTEKMETCLSSRSPNP